MTQIQDITNTKQANLGAVEDASYWEWAVNKGPANHFRYITTQERGMLARITELGDMPTAEEFFSLRQSGMIFGAVEQCETLYAELKFNFSEFISRYDLSADGRIDFSDPEESIRVNAYFHNAILSADRFIVQVGVVIDKTFGKDSAQAKKWRDRKSELLKRDLSFGYCLEERNHIEHVLKPLAIIDLEPWRHVGGIGVNLESDYTSYDRKKLPKEYKLNRDTFIQRRMEKGRRPFLSIAGMMPTIQMAIMVLYATAFECFETCLRERAEIAFKIGGQHISNGLLMLPVDHGNSSYVEPRRILRWGTPAHVNVFEQRCERLKQFISDLPDNPKVLANPPAYKMLLY